LEFIRKICLRPQIALLPAALAIGLSACAPAPRISTINDPLEVQNRKRHEANKRLDQAILKPLSGAVGGKGGGPISRGISNFASNLSLPGVILNDMLQLNLPEAFSNTARFVMNSTVGLAGVLDVATQNGLSKQDSDFGETLYVWGMPEGRYLELPLLGPSTERDAIGKVVDFLIDPVDRLVPAPQRYVGTAAKALDTVGDRGRYSGLVDSVLYESEDSYAQSRLLYLQSRRRVLYGELTEDDLEDPYAE